MFTQEEKKRVSVSVSMLRRLSKCMFDSIYTLQEPITYVSYLPARPTAVPRDHFNSE